MTSYCTAGQSARVTWQFAGKAERSVLLNDTPIDVSVYPAFGTNCSSLFANTYDGSSNRYKTLYELSSSYYYEITSLSLRINTKYVYVHNAGVGYSQKIYLGGNYVSPGQLTVFPINPPVPVNSNSMLEAYDVLSNGTESGRLGSISVVLRRCLINEHRIDITGNQGYFLRDTGAAAPTFSVACNGCPPNTLDCGCQCVDCSDVSLKLKKIHERLQ